MPRLLRSGLSSLRYVGRALGGFTLALNVFAVVVTALAVALPGSDLPAVAVPALVVVFVARVAYEIVKERRAGVNDRLRMGTKTLSRMLATLAALAVDSSDGARTGTVVAATIVLVLIVGEQAMRRPVRAAMPLVANIADWDVPLPSSLLANWFYGLNTAAVVVLAFATPLGLSQLLAVAVSAVAAVLAVLIGAQSGRYLVGRRRLDANLPKILDRLQPEFAFHWQAPAGTAYQAAMWLPYLERIGVPYFVLVRTAANFREVSQMTDAPVILRVGLEDLDAVVCPSLKVVFYANTAVRNSHMIRFPHLTHIQLNHGDSDKIASVSPTFRQYDRNFVAGQAAIDRFATHGVSTLVEQFEIVGRPQLEHVQPAGRPIATVDRPTVLYAPTWSGFYEDSDYSSLSAGRTIVEELLRRGCLVVFRPHPYARRVPANARACDEIIALLGRDQRQAGTPHVFGPAAETAMSVVDCFNASDALISDVSSVVSDYLISSKPFAMAAVSAHGEAFAAEFPMARAAYVFDVTGRKTMGLNDVLDDMLGPDSHAGPRLSLRSYYLSDTPPERITERFLETAREYLRPTEAAPVRAGTPSP